MVKDWERPPGIDQALGAYLNLTPDRRDSEELRQLVRKANTEYWPWHVLRHKAGAAGIAPECVWAAVKLTRMVPTRELPLMDTSGRPFKYWIPDAGHEHLHFLDRHLGGPLLAEHPGALQAQRETYLVNSLMEEAIASSVLEGAATTRRVAKDMLRSGRAPRDRSERMILNNYRTIQQIKEVADQPLTIGLVCELHASMTRDTLDSPEMCGRLRCARDNVVVGGPDGTIVHVPPPADELPERMELMCQFANDEANQKFMHPMVRAILLHFWLAHDHPFVDGNGRTARALFYWHLLRKRYWLIEFLCISKAILGAPEQYSRAFVWSERDDQDATYFVMFHLRKLRQAVRDLQNYLKVKGDELRKSDELLAKFEGLNHRQRALLAHALRHPDARYTIAYHRNCHNVAYPTARADLLGLAERKLLQQDKIGREFVFTPVPELAQELGAEP